MQLHKPYTSYTSLVYYTIGVSSSRVQLRTEQWRQPRPVRGLHQPAGLQARLSGPSKYSWERLLRAEVHPHYAASQKH